MIDGSSVVFVYDVLYLGWTVYKQIAPLRH